MTRGKAKINIRKVTYEYFGDGRDIDVFLELAVRDYCGERLRCADFRHGFIDKVESEV